MKRPGKRAYRVLAAAVIAPPILWVLVVLFLPMEWARARLVVSLKDATRQDIRLASVRLGPFGGIRLNGLEIAARQSSDDPWLKIASVAVDASLFDLLRGTFTSTDCHLSGMSLRIRRDRAGRLEFEDLLNPEKKAAPESPGAAGAHTAPEVTFHIEDATILVDDQATDSRLEFTDVLGLGSDDGTVANVAHLTGLVNGGTFTLTARADRSDGLMIDGQIRSRDVALDAGMKALAYFIPFVANPPSGPHARGTLSFELDLRAQGKTANSLAEALTGRGSMALDDLTLDDSRVMAEMTKVLPVPARGKLGSIRGDFQLASRRVTTSNTVLRIGGVPVSLVGWSDLDGHLDYLVKCEKLGKTVSGLARKLPPEARELLADLPVDDLGGLAGVRVSGSINRLTVRPVDGGVLASKNGSKDPSRRAEDRAKLKAAGKKFLDKVLR
ncbi:MAG: uncharacterized protein JWN86_1087 [Planctomycetota bacterium]|nr:uncharacterized protein [Planctomycetota bacterium]